MNEPEPGMFLVLCREDTRPDGSPGDYVVTAKRSGPFATEEKAMDYAASINPSRYPLVVQVVSGGAVVEPEPEPADYDPLFGKPLT